jgi:hypothetical protein
MDMMPPAGYDHQPAVQVEDHVLTSDVVNRICWEKKTTGWDGRPPPPSYHFAGCSHLVGGRCEVWRIDDGMVRRHEYAHCNGWPGNHPTFVVAAPKPVAPPVAKPLEVKSLQYGIKTATDLTPKLAPWPVAQQTDMTDTQLKRGLVLRALIGARPLPESAK